MPSEFGKRGGWWVIAQGVLFVSLLILCWLYRGSLAGSWWLALGAAFLVMGAVIGLAGALALGRNLTPFPRPTPGGTLVQTGIYGLMRHPVYTAVFCGAVGWALVWGSAPGLAVALGFAPFFDTKARREERWLREQFPGYADYERRVRRFVPWLY